MVAYLFPKLDANINPLFFGQILSHLALPLNDKTKIFIISLWQIQNLMHTNILNDLG